MRIYHTTIYNSFYCPECNRTLKKRKVYDYGNDTGYWILVCICFFPIFIIVWLIKKVVENSISKSKMQTIFKEELVFCKKCKSFVAITNNGTRLLSKCEIDETIVPRYKNSPKFQKKYNSYLSSNEVNPKIWKKT